MLSFSLCLSRAEKKQSETKIFFPLSPEPARGKWLFQLLFKDPEFLYFSPASTSFYPPLAVCFTTVQMPHSSKVAFMHPCLNTEVLIYLPHLQCQSKY